MRNKRRTDEEWLSLIQQCRSSGLSDRVWCEQNDISINTFYNTVTKLRRKSCMVPEAVRSTSDGLHEIVPLSITEESHIPMRNPSVTLSTDIVSEGEALTVIINDCKVAVNNHAGRDVIHHTISALRNRRSAICPEYRKSIWLQEGLI